MKATLPPFAPLVLKLAGGTLILLYLLDCVILLSTAKFQDSQWMLGFTTQLVDRGLNPLTGLALLFAGFWADDTSSDTAGRGQGIKLAALLLSSVLGLLFLLLIPLHVNTTRTAVDAQLKQVGDEANKAETQLNSQVQAARAQLDVQLSTLDQVVRTGQLQGQTLSPEDVNRAKQEQERLRKLKADPKALDAQISPARNQELTRIRDRKNELETQIRDNSLRAGLRTGLGSLLLALAYTIVGWTGLRRLLASR